MLGADDYDQDVRFSGEKAVFMGVWVLPNANSLDVIGDVRRGDRAASSASCRRACRPTVAFDSTDYIDDAIHEVVEDADRDDR